MLAHIRRICWNSVKWQEATGRAEAKDVEKVNHLCELLMSNPQTGKEDDDCSEDDWQLGDFGDSSPKRRFCSEDECKQKASPRTS